ncbi:hypothetical protein [Leptotrichia sp. OH3620_COT-345]|uniref:hypothetical protein n=1 Tax=Leptotrichia sp. OH3620_COT-345 TaxID=2491048 RepID=UPI0018F37A16|nr:hypothetical protein [Leptotrichia sp. OH3620_COT-345]
MLRGFPITLKDDVSTVIDVVSKKKYNNVECGVSENFCKYILLSGEEIFFPYRIYYVDVYKGIPSLTFEQRMIYHCIFSRSCDGFVREKHIKSIFNEDYPDWVIPYIFKISDEYVVEILEIIYSKLKNENTDKIKKFCRLNLNLFLYSYDRMISYWNEFYRKRYPDYKKYVGRELYNKCFGYTKNMKKIATGRK